ncbi:MAG: hypothetical protein GY811_06235 [Myxococcales bacterium]|nr:hypothetical protein [Myxococcales bacterium]
MQLQQEHDLGYPCPGYSLSARNLGSVLNLFGVELSLPLFGLAESLHNRRWLQPLRAQAFSRLAEVDDEAAQNSPTTGAVGGRPKEARVIAGFFIWGGFLVGELPASP